MKKLIFVFALACFTQINAQDQLSRLSVKGNQFVNESGEKIVLRGLNTSDPDKLEKQNQWNKVYFQEIKDWGATVVRFPVHPSRWRDRGEKAYLQLLDDGIKWCTELGLYVIIDWHSIGNLQTQLYLHPMYFTTPLETRLFWKTIAEKYGNNTTVAFYELFNEPTRYQGKFGTLSWEEWKEVNEELITIIRAYNAEGIPLVAGFNWAYDLTEAFNNPIAAEGVGYVSHPYPQKRPKPWIEQWDKDWGMMKEKYPVICTEMGFAGEEERGAHVPVISDESYGETITKYFDEKDISYVVWVFDAEWDPSLFDDWEFKNLTRHGKFFKEKLQQYD